MQLQRARPQLPTAGMALRHSEVASCAACHWHSSLSATLLRLQLRVIARSQDPILTCVQVARLSQVETTSAAALVSLQTACCMQSQQTVHLFGLQLTWEASDVQQDEVFEY
jgi:ABC-type transporter Mla MlaB component